MSSPSAVSEGELFDSRSRVAAAEAQVSPQPPSQHLSLPAAGGSAVSLTPSEDGPKLSACELVTLRGGEGVFRLVPLGVARPSTGAQETPLLFAAAMFAAEGGRDGSDGGSIAGPAEGSEVDSDLGSDVGSAAIGDLGKVGIEGGVGSIGEMA